MLYRTTLYWEFTECMYFVFSIDYKCFWQDSSASYCGGFLKCRRCCSYELKLPFASCLHEPLPPYWFTDYTNANKSSTSNVGRCLRSYTRTASSLWGTFTSEWLWCIYTRSSKNSKKELKHFIVFFCLWWYEYLLHFLLDGKPVWIIPFFFRNDLN